MDGKTMVTFSLKLGFREYDLQTRTVAAHTEQPVRQGLWLELGSYFDGMQPGLVYPPT